MDINTVKINLLAAIQGLSEWTEKSSVLSALAFTRSYRKI